MAQVGNVTVRVRPDTKRFDQELRQQLSRIKDLTVKVKADLDSSGLQTDLKRTASQAKATAKVDTDLDGRTLRQKLQDAIRRALAGVDPTVHVDADTKTAMGKIRAFAHDMVVAAKVELDAHDAQRKLDDLKGTAKVDVDLKKDAASARIGMIARNRDVNLNVKVRGLAEAGAALAALSGARVLKDVFSNIGDGLKGLDRSAPKIAGIATGIAGLTAVAGSAVSSVGGLAGSIASMAGAGLALPAVFAAGAAGIGVLAMSLKDAKTQLAGLAPAFKGLQSSVSGAFWAKAAAPIQNLATSVLPSLQAGMTRTATLMGQGWATFANTLRSSLNVSGMFAGINGMFAQLNTGVAGATRGFSAMLQVGSSYLPRLGAAVSEVANRFGSWATAAASSGAMNRMIDAGIQAAIQLGAVIGAAARIITGVFGAAAQAGATSLQTLNTALSTVSAAVNSVSGQAALVSFFQSANQAVTALLPGLGAVGQAIGTLMPAIQASMVTAGQAIGQALTGIATALSQPAISTGIQMMILGVQTAVAGLLPAMAPVGTAIGTLMTTIGTLVGQLGPVLGAALSAVAPIITSLGTALQPIIVMLGTALTGAIQALMPAFTAIAGLLAPLGQLLGAILAPALQLISGLIAAISPFVTALVGVITQIAAAMVPIAQQMMSALLPAFQQLLPVISQLALALLPVFQQVFAALLPVIQQLLPVLLQLATAILPVVAQVLQSIMPLLPLIGQLIAAIVPVIMGLLIPAIQAIMPIITTVFQAIVPIIQGAVQIIQGVLQVLIGLLKGDFSMVWQGLGNIVGGAWNTVVAIIQGAVQIIGSILGALGGIVTSIVGAFVNYVVAQWNLMVAKTQEDFNNISNFISSALTAIGAFFSSVWNSIVAVVSGAWNAIVSAISSGVNSFVSTIRGGIQNAIGAFQNLASGALNALRGLVSNALSIGSDIVNGIVNGVRGAAGALFGALKDLASGALNAAKSALGIHSPSRVMAAQVGKWIPAGIAKGLQGNAKTVTKATQQLASGIAKTFTATGKRSKTSMLGGLRDELAGLQAQKRRVSAGPKTAGRQAQLKQIEARMANVRDQIRSIQRMDFSGNAQAQADAFFRAYAASTTWTLQRLAQQRDRLTGALKNANARLKGQLDEWVKYRDSMKQRLDATFDLGTLSQNTSRGLDMSGILLSAKEAQAQVKVFGDRLSQLARRGLNKGLLDQIAQMTPKAGADMAGEILKGSKSQLAALNASYAAIQRTNTIVANGFTSTMYKAGIDATRGLIQGIQSQLKAVDKVSSILANRLVSGVRSRLGIHSPSRVMADMVGRHIPSGIAMGIESGAADYRAALDSTVAYRPQIPSPVMPGVDAASGQGAGRTLSDADIAALASVLSFTFKVNDREIARAASSGAPKAGRW